MKTKHVQTDWVNRIHVYVDPNAAVINCFAVTLPPYFNEPGLIVPQREGKSMEDTWQEALSTVRFLRQQPFTPIAPPDQFNPFGIITACNFADVVLDHEIRMQMMLGGCFLSETEHARIDQSTEQFPDHGAEFHERRVDSLIRAWGLLDAAIRGEPHTGCTARH
jgi:hypothetical protein